MNDDRQREVKQRAEAVASNCARALAGELDVADALRSSVANAEKIVRQVDAAEGERQLDQEL